MKTCSQCNEEKSIDEFIKHGMYRNSKCHPCRLAYQKKINEKWDKAKRMQLW